MYSRFSWKEWTICSSLQHQPKVKNLLFICGIFIFRNHPNQTAVNPTKSRSPNPSTCDKSVYEPASGNAHAFMRSDMRSEMCDLPRSRNAFLAQLVGPRRAQQETEWVHPAGAWVGMVYVCVLAATPKNLNGSTTLHLPPTSLQVCHYRLSSTWRYSSSPLLSAAHKTSVPPPAFFFFLFWSHFLSFFPYPVQFHLLSFPPPSFPLLHISLFLLLIPFSFFFFCVKTWKIEAPGSSGCLFPHHFYHSVLVADCCRCFLC